jgi:hypothetical protein
MKKGLHLPWLNTFPPKSPIFPPAPPHFPTDLPKKEIRLPGSQSTCPTKTWAKWATWTN